MRSMVERETPAFVIVRHSNDAEHRAPPSTGASEGRPRPDVLIASLALAGGLLKDRFAAAQRRARRARP